MTGTNKTRVANRRVVTEDAAIGKRIRTRRMHMKISQEALGKELGVSFQQIQKYEKGQNRVPSSRLMKIAEVLKMEAGELIGTAKQKHEAAPYADFLATHIGVELTTVVATLNKKNQRAVLDLARSLARPSC